MSHIIICYVIINSICKIINYCPRISKHKQRCSGDNNCVIYIML